MPVRLVFVRLYELLAGAYVSPAQNHVLKKTPPPALAKKQKNLSHPKSLVFFDKRDRGFSGNLDTA
jgi:hypothetical protein